MKTGFKRAFQSLFCVIGFVYAFGGGNDDESGSCPMSGKDYHRAHTSVPKEEYRGDGVYSTMTEKLNAHLIRLGDEYSMMEPKACADFTLEELRDLQLEMYDLIHPSFQKIYEMKVVRGNRNDGRNMKYESIEELLDSWNNDIEAHSDSQFEANIFRDAKCHEIVMWYIHHLTEDTRKNKNSIKMKNQNIPLLPTHTYGQLSKEKEHLKDVFKKYNESLTCISCHNGGHNDIPSGDHPLNKGPNGEAAVAWPDEFYLEFNLSVETDHDQKGIPAIKETGGNRAWFKWNDHDPKALMKHETCPFFKWAGCDILHRKDGIYLTIHPSGICCKAFDIPPVSPAWVTWGYFVETVQVEEGFLADHWRYGEVGQPDEHDYFCRHDDPSKPIRFHATLPPPNTHSHGYWHIYTDPVEGPQDNALFEVPRHCHSTCHLPSHVTPNSLLEAGMITEEHHAKVSVLYALEEM